jgi:rRNA maturation protein Nop10
MSHAGVYTFVANVPGCGPVFDLVTISVNSRIPLNYALGSNSPLCEGGTLTLSAQDLQGSNYLWTGPNGFSSTSRIVSIGNVPTSARGQYFVTVTKSSCNPVARTTNVFVGHLELPVITATSPVCSGDLLNIRTQFSSDATYSWTGPNGYTSNLHDFYITQSNPTHSGVYSLNANVPGCGGISNSISVTVNDPFPLNPQMSSNSPICVGSDLVLGVANHPSANYMWTGPNGFTSNNRNPIVNFAQSSASGVYSVMVHVPGCPSRGLQVVTSVNPLPTINTSSNSPLCAGSALFLNASITPSITPVSWAGPNGFSSNMLGASISNVQTLNSGNYTFFVNVPGCGVLQSVRNVVVNSAVTTTAVTGSTTVCVGNTLSLSASLTQNAIYSWTGPLGFTSNERAISIPGIQLNQAGNYSLTVNQQGCNPFTAVRTVTVNNITPPVASSDRAVYCSGQPIYFTSTAVVGALAYNWSGPAGYSMNNRWASRSNSNITHAGEYTLQVPTTQCGTYISTVQILVGPAINVTTATANTPACVGSTLNLMSNIADAPGVVHTWIAPNATTFNTRNVALNGVDMSAAGTYTYIVSSPGCGSATRTRRVAMSDPSLVSATSNSPVCQGQAIFFTGTGPAGSTYSWQGPGGYIATTQFPARANAQLSHAGDYTLNANVPGCGIVSTTTNVLINVCRYADENAEESTDNLPTENQELLSSMKVYPNPFSTEVNIEWGDMMVFSIKVYDLHGKLVREMEPGDVKAVKFESSDLPSGVYLMTALTSVGPVSYRITRL